MSETSIKCTNCSEFVSPSFLSDHVCGQSAGGMAGVGRRAFKHLMIGTPPLSPLSFEYGLRTPSPLSPRIATPTSPYLFPFPYHPQVTPSIQPQHPPPPLSLPEAISVPPRIRTPSHSPTPKSPLSQVMVAPTPQSRTPKLPFLEKYKNSTTATRPPPQQTYQSEAPLPSSHPYQDEEEEEETGLAYDRDVEDPPLSPTSTSSHSVYSSATRLTRDFLSSPPPLPLPPLPTSPPTTNSVPMSPPRRSHTNPTTGPRGGTAGVPSPFGPSSPPLGTMRSISDAKQHHSRRPRDSDSGPDVSSGSTSLSSQISDIVTTTTTTTTTATVPASPGSAMKKPRVRICVKCDMQIENGRWIRMDGGKGILCETCWKHMYLPRCRRCSKVIETAAVYSSDGQLKGKYHKHCFTCTICDTPFQSNTFWIYQGQPMCEYHYHESNRSLCAAKNCRKPIEGSCAITEGDVKYHPACLICSTPGCTERLEEYWEIEGRMLCEQHVKELELPESPTSPSTNTAPAPAPTVTPTKRSSPPSVRAIPSMFRPMDPSQRLQKRTTKLINIQSALAF